MSAPPPAVAHATGSAGAAISHRRIVFASFIGTAIEFYDFYVYATAAALVIGPVFFPHGSATAQALSAFVTFGIAFIARPIGSFLFGHFGDRIGRKSTLVASLLVMGVSTTAIGFVPGYDTIGALAPVLLCVLRFGQGIGLGGEWGGAALLAVENAPPGWRARFGMMPQLGAPVGFIAANGLFLILGALLTEEQFMAWGWRIPFLGSAVLVGVGLWVRLKLTETPEFAAALEEAPPPSVPLGELFGRHLGATLAATLGVICCFAIFYLSTTFALGQATQIMGLKRETVLIVQLCAILLMAIGIVHAGWWSDRTSPRRVLIAGCLGTVPMGFVFGPLLISGSYLQMFFGLALALYLMGLTYGPLGAWLTDRFPTRVRYTGASVAFNAGGIVGGAGAPIAAQILTEALGGSAVGYYLSVAAALSLIGLLLSPKD